MSVAEHSLHRRGSEQTLMQLSVEQSQENAETSYVSVDFPGSPTSSLWHTPAPQGILLNTSPAAGRRLTGNYSNEKHCVTWQVLDGFRTVSFGPAEDEDELLTAIWNGDVQKVREIVTSEEMPISLMRLNKDGWTPVHEAAYYGQTDCLKLLLSAVPTMINTRTNKDQTPLILSVSKGHLVCVKYLLEKEADPKIPTKTNETPLYEACATNNDQMVLLLLRNGADVNQKCLDRWTALHESVLQNNLEICEILVAYGAQVTSSNIFGVSPLFLAAQYGFVEAVQLLVKNGADINSEAIDGATALYEACKNGYYETVEFLLSCGADANRPGKDGLLPLHIAAKHGHDGIISMLIMGTSRTKIWFSGISPLHLAAENNEDEALDLLIRAGFDVNTPLAPDHSCMYEDRRTTALYFTVANGNIESASMLLLAGANPNLDVFNPLLLAVRQGHLKMATLLMEHGANVNASIPTHPTTFPACVMLSVGNLAMLKRLMHYGVDASACFWCKYGLKQHLNNDTTHSCRELQYSPEMATNSCLQFCEMVSHPSVYRWAGSTIDLLLDYVGHVTLCSRLIEYLERYEEWTYIKEKSILPQHLMQLCRIRIRQLLGRERLKSISTLDLPGRLIKYLNHEQEDVL
ncbi:ankyrin repeat and SOCS box protein 2-like isoform X1 [Electrophorus electricus]|uniref:ankyrin repeat and SOCS box protein 2-like isoform X1 n=1 Tax=Electrophorus electricus TaxID=8005 RepID=UPI0015CFDFB5|nr:ankyrin repeat and SOCS box protein 2-like isoform X1 [Electrophorus electricus]XP_026854707.2 ankyrin repeat and SOCS box protein 2-like isoform X1 [Electrophorus electricus]